MTLLIVICALGVALITAAAAVAVWRARATADERVAEAVRQLAAGMNETILDLTDSIETARAASQGDRYVEELAASLDFDAVATRTLDAVERLPGVDAASLDSPAPGTSQAETTVGMAPEEAAKVQVTAPANDNLRAVDVSFRYRIDAVDGAANVVRSAVVVPLRGDGGQFGSLSAYTRSSRPLPDDTVEEIERLA
ncbi:MAG: hypothetical protein ACRDM1_06575, partial [Gaiellaceae bacterium]